MLLNHLVLLSVQVVYFLLSIYNKELLIILMLILTHLLLLIQQKFVRWIHYARPLFGNYRLKDIFFSLFHHADVPRWKFDNKKDTRIIFLK